MGIKNQEIKGKKKRTTGKFAGSLQKTIYRMSAETKLKLNEETFNMLLPGNIKAKSKRFFTPADVAIKAAKWLSGNDRRKILDIGAGVGKFCVFGACHTQSEFFGIEMRKHLVEIAENIFEVFDVKNAKIINRNITDFQFFSDFAAFYIYNPFHENIVPYLRMDDSILLSPDFYGIYMQHTRSQLARAQIGTRLATYHGLNMEVPVTYRKVEEHNGGDLKFWIKEI